MSDVLNFPNGGEDFKPILSHEQMGEIEIKYQAESGVNRRILLAVLTMNAGKLKEAAHENPNLWLETFDCGTFYFVHNHEFMQMIQTACYRLMMALGDLETSEMSLEQLETYERLCGELMAHKVEVLSRTKKLRRQGIRSGLI